MGAEWGSARRRRQRHAAASTSARVLRLRTTGRPPARDRVPKMPGGEGSYDPIDCKMDSRTNETDGRKFTTAEDDLGSGVRGSENNANNGDNDNNENDPATGAAVTGDGLRRRKVIRAAKETLDKGKSHFR